MREKNSRNFISPVDSDYQDLQCSFIELYCFTMNACNKKAHNHKHTNRQTHRHCNLQTDNRPTIAIEISTKSGRVYVKET